MTTETHVVERIRYIEVHSLPAALVSDRHTGMAQQTGRLRWVARFHLVRIQFFVSGFIDGSIALDIPWPNLSPEQRAGKRLYMSACISCHDQPNTSGGEAIWETRAVSFPRKHFSHRSPPLDAVSAASPYARHELQIVPVNMSDEEAAGLLLYSENCAFCHAPDGSGQNWIGSFLDPKPRDFTARTFVLTATPDAMRAIIKSGIVNTSMPAWQHVLSDMEIDAIVAYIRIAFRPES